MNALSVTPSANLRTVSSRRQKILNKVEFSDAGIDGARIDPLIDVSDEVEGNITVSSFTDTNDVGGNDSKEKDSSDGTVDEDVATERTATEATLNGDSNEAAENTRKVTGTASPRPATFGTTKNSQTDPSNVQGDREIVTTPGSASSTTPVM
uniref:Uncharacterized protein n=1 Tax=Anopheles atroparvus TaxID=41427 RepID=A0A182JIM1_ANOAO